MTAPIQPIAAVVPPLSTSSSQTQKELLGVTDRVSLATGGASTKEVRKVSGLAMTAAATLPSIPDPQKVVASVKQGLQTLLEMASPVRNIILTGLSNIELENFEVALSKGTTLKEEYKPLLQGVKDQIAKIKQKRKEQLLEEILADHPTWQSKVKGWNNVSLEDKIWLLQVFELSCLGICFNSATSIPPSDPSHLLKSSTKNSIIDDLSKVEKLDLSRRSLTKCPKAIELLVNLETLDLSYNSLTVPPDVSRNLNLKVVNLSINPQLFLM